MNEVAGRRVDDALGLAGRARRVERVQRMLGVEGGRFASSALPRHHVVPPMVASGAHLDRVSYAAHHQTFFDRSALLQRQIDIGLERNFLPAAPSTVSRDAYFGLGVVDSI